MKTSSIVMTITAVAAVLVLASYTAPQAAYAAPLAKLGKAPWKLASDNYGDQYKFKYTAHTKNPRQFTGNLLNAPADGLWPISGTQQGNRFTFTVTNPNPSNGFCGYTVTGRFDTADSASASWTNTCGDSGTLTMTAGGPFTLSTTTGPRPFEPQ